MTQNAKNAKRVCGEKVAKEWRTCGESRDILVVFVAKMWLIKKTAPPWYALLGGVRESLQWIASTKPEAYDHNLAMPYGKPSVITSCDISS